MSKLRLLSLKLVKMQPTMCLRWRFSFSDNLISRDLLKTRILSLQWTSMDEIYQFKWCPLKPKFHLARHICSRLNTTRYAAHAFWHREKSWCDDMCLACWTAGHDTLVTTSATRMTRLQTHCHSVYLGERVHLTEAVPEIDHANPEHKRLNLYTQALLLLCHPPCWNKHGLTHSS